MRKIIIGLVAALSFGTAASADQYVRGYTKKDGTYVAPHYRSSPNSTTSDNWSTRGNTNPYTGQPGTKPATPSYGYTPSYTPPAAPKPPSYGSPYSSTPPKPCYSIYGC